jgi:hypothetical protein
MALFPGWLPTDALLVFFVTLIIAIVVMNRGVPWIINTLAIDEPLIVALGLFVVAMATRLADTVGGEVLWWTGIGALVSLFGLYAYRSDSVDVGGLVG